MRSKALFSLVSILLISVPVGSATAPVANHIAAHRPAQNHVAAITPDGTVSVESPPTLNLPRAEELTVLTATASSSVSPAAETTEKTLGRTPSAVDTPAALAEADVAGEHVARGSLLRRVEAETHAHVESKVEEESSDEQQQEDGGAEAGNIVDDVKNLPMTVSEDTQTAVDADSGLQRASDTLAGEKQALEVGLSKGHAPTNTEQPPTGLEELGEETLAPKPELLLAHAAGEETSIVQDCTLQGLVKLVNSFDRWGDFEDKQSEGDAVKAFFEHMEPWILAEPAIEPKTPDAMEELRPIVPEIDCEASQYSQLFTGQPLVKPKFIVDIVPFGLDLTLLELRLLEIGSIVDLFVISEAETNKKGKIKPLIFQKAMEQPRFARFRHKILHVIRRATPNMLKTNQSYWFHETRTRGFPSACLASLVWDDQSAQCLMHNLGNNTAFEDQCGFIREEDNIPRRAIGPWGVPKAALAALKSSRSTALVLQNDEDELIKGDVLLHVKNCELSNSDPELYAPSVHHKMNVNWVEKSSDNLQCLRGAGAAQAPDLLNYLWRPAVVIARLEKVSCGREDNGLSLEADGTNFLRRNSPCERPGAHLGIGSSIHLSSVGEPMQGWLKDFSVLDGITSNAFPSALVDAGKRKQINSTHLFAEKASRMARDICKADSRWLHISHLSQAAQEIAEASRPWAMRVAPQRFCFYIPNVHASRDAEPFADMARADFPNGCEDSAP